MDKTQNNLELRNLLNDFFQDIDPDAIIGDNIANRIVDVHLAKIQKYLDSQIKQSNEQYIRKCGVMGGNVYLKYKGGCEENDDIKNMYRCGGCGGWFHKDCLYKHFNLERRHDYGAYEAVKEFARYFKSKKKLWNPYDIRELMCLVEEFIEQYKSKESEGE